MCLGFGRFPSRVRNRKHGEDNSGQGIQGSQGRHFNTIKNNGRPREFYDSRLFHAEKEFQAALELFRQGYEAKSLGRLGKELHSLQDYFAHRDWDPGPFGLNRHPA